MFMNGLAGPVLVRAYALERLVDAVQQRKAGRPEPSRRGSTAALGWVLRAAGRRLIRLGDWLQNRSLPPPMIDICG